MTKAIRIHTNGGPEVMVWEDVPTPEPGPGEALIKQAAIGLNFIDVYFRTGLYKAPNMPLIIGQEGAGTVVALGANVTNVSVGDRVAYAGAIGRLCDGTGDRGRPAGETSGQHRFPNRRCNDAPGYDCAIFVAPDPRGEGRRNDCRACRGRWCRLDHLPVGKAPRRDGHRGCLQQGKRPSWPAPMARRTQ